MSSHKSGRRFGSFAGRSAQAYLGLVLSILLGLVACEGPAGPAGRAGKDGARGQDGKSPEAGAVEPRDSGSPVRDAATDAAVAFEGLTGRVTDATERTLTGGRVVLVPTFRVKELSKQALTLTQTPAEAAASPLDEPLEDVIDAFPADLTVAELGPNGAYRFESVPDGEFFVVFLPGASDPYHLPGGDPSHTPRAATTLRGATLDLRVSSRPSDVARYVGSTPCLTCHGRHTSLASAHALTLRVPGQNGQNQDIVSVPRINEAMAAFEQGQKLYFYDCAPGREPLPSCRVRAIAPSPSDGELTFSVQLGRDLAVPVSAPGAYYVELISRDGTDVRRYPVVLTVGGALSYQQFVTRVELPAGGYTYLTLPFSYQLSGSDSRPSYRDYVWVDYRSEDWADLAQGTLKQAAYAQAFDRQCAGCHVTGFALRGDETLGFRASAAVDRDGVFDFDGDGSKELLAVGCESCHGPGSEHIELSPRGQRIVSPRLLTPERQSALCGSCHGRGRGVHGELLPLNEAGQMPRPGIRRSELVGAHLSVLSAPEDAPFSSGDARLGRDQYSEFVRSAKYRSPNLLVSCMDCHAAHREPGIPSDLRFAANDDQASCAGCHAEPKDIHAHALKTVKYDHVRGVEQTALTCTRCHMPKTATAGAHRPGLSDRSNPNAFVDYVTGDRTSHRFEFADRAHASEQPVVATDGCAYCHGDFLPDP